MDSDRTSHRSHTRISYKVRSISPSRFDPKRIPGSMGSSLTRTCAQHHARAPADTLIRTARLTRHQPCMRAWGLTPSLPKGQLSFGLSCIDTHTKPKATSLGEAHYESWRGSLLLSPRRDTSTQGTGGSGSASGPDRSDTRLEHEAVAGYVCVSCVRSCAPGLWRRCVSRVVSKV